MLRKTFVILVAVVLIFVFLPDAGAAEPPNGYSMEAPEELVFFQEGSSNPDLQFDDDPPTPDNLEYINTIRQTADLVWDEKAQALAAQYGLNILNVTWEDTGRYYGSSVGPNISDVTIQVQHPVRARGEYGLSLMPVIRYPNFTDLTGDVPMDDFYLLVGNEAGDSLERVSLREYLGNFRAYLSDPGSWLGRGHSLLAPRDSHVLVSAQAAFLPVPSGGQAEFNPVIFNYQSYSGDPAVLTIVATREGTSATVIDNTRDAFPAGFSWGQRLFFNQAGERASFTGERLSDFNHPPQPRSKTGPGGAQVGGETGLNMVMIIQVPLKQKNPNFGLGDILEDAAAAPAPAESEKSDVEVAVIGHGEVEGPFTELDDLRIERDPRFPIRVTVQFYKATSNGEVSEGDMAEIAAQIERVYDEADYVGSLVVGGPSDRPTEYDGSKIEPEEWWQAFWMRFEENTKLSRYEAIEILEWLRMVARIP